MISGNTSHNFIRKIFLLFVVIDFVLVILSWILDPTINFVSIASVFFILVVYGLAGYLGFSRINPELFPLIGMFGLLAGAIYTGEILSEYAVLPKDNTSWGLIEFGSVFSLFFLCSLLGSYQHKSIKAGTISAIVSAMLSSVIWLGIVLLTFYIFRGTARQETVFRAEGNFEDFARSGMNDFNTFIIEDFLGAGFFHLLLSPVVAAILGLIGSLLGKGFAKLRKR